MTRQAKQIERVKRGLCRQCGSRRGEKCPSKSRCPKCVEKNRLQQRRRRHNAQAYRPGGPGRRPLF